jgi:hypothetical protein
LQSIGETLIIAPPLVDEDRHIEEIVGKIGDVLRGG